MGASARLCQAPEHTWPWGLLCGSAWLWRTVQSKAKAPQGRRGARKGCLPDRAGLFLDTCFSRVRCPPRALAPPAKPL